MRKDKVVIRHGNSKNVGLNTINKPFTSLGNTAAWGTSFGVEDGVKLAKLMGAKDGSDALKWIVQNPNAVSTGAGVAQGLFGAGSNFMNAAQLKDTSEYQSAIDAGFNFNPSTSSFDALASDMDNRTYYSNINAGFKNNDLVGKEWWKSGLEAAGQAGLEALRGNYIGAIGDIVGWAGGTAYAYGKSKQIADQLNAKQQEAQYAQSISGIQAGNRINQNNYASQMIGRAFGGPLFAYGGDMQYSGGDFTNGLIKVNEGGSHESSPIDGVPMGVDSQGTPNLVEEGEVIYNDYVYSNRIYPNAHGVAEGLLPNKLANHTFAWGADFLSKSSEERPLDNIAKRTFEANMERLKALQEKVKDEHEQEETEKELSTLSMEGQTFAEGGDLNQKEVSEEEYIKYYDSIKKDYPELKDVLWKNLTDDQKQQIRSSYHNFNELQIEESVKSASPSTSKPSNIKSNVQSNVQSKVVGLDLNKAATARPVGLNPYLYTNEEIESMLEKLSPNNDEINTILSSEVNVDGPKEPKVNTKEIAKVARQVKKDVAAKAKAAKKADNTINKFLKSNDPNIEKEFSKTQQEADAILAPEDVDLSYNDAAIKEFAESLRGRKDIPENIKGIKTAKDFAKEFSNTVTPQEVLDSLGIDHTLKSSYKKPKSFTTQEVENENIDEINPYDLVKSVEGLPVQNVNLNDIAKGMVSISAPNLSQYQTEVESENINDDGEIQALKDAATAKRISDTEKASKAFAEQLRSRDFINPFSQVVPSVDLSHYIEEIPEENLQYDPDIFRQTQAARQAQLQSGYPEFEALSRNYADKLQLGPFTNPFYVTPGIGQYSTDVEDEILKDPFDSELAKINKRNAAAVRKAQRKENFSNFMSSVGDVAGDVFTGIGTVAAAPFVAAGNLASSAWDGLKNIKFNNMSKDKKSVASKDTVETDPRKQETYSGEGLRYVPAVGSALNARSDWMGLTNTPDYTHANNLQREVNRFRDPRFVPLSNYIKSTPIDRMTMVNQLNNSYLGQMGALREASGANRGALLAGLTGLGYAGSNALGNAYLQAIAQQNAQNASDAQFNRGTNQFNSEGLLKTLSLAADISKARVAGTDSVGTTRDTENARVSANRMANWNSLLHNAGEVGVDTTNRNMVINNPALLYSPMGKYLGFDPEKFSEWMKTQSTSPKDPTEKASVSACGGYLTVKNKRRK